MSGGGLFPSFTYSRTLIWKRRWFGVAQEIATHSSILVWKISWTEKPGGSAMTEQLIHTHTVGWFFIFFDFFLFFFLLLRILVLGQGSYPRPTVEVRSQPLDLQGSSSRLNFTSKHSETSDLPVRYELDLIESYLVKLIGVNSYHNSSTSAR